MGWNEGRDVRAKKRGEMNSGNEKRSSVLNESGNIVRGLNEIFGTLLPPGDRDKLLGMTASRIE